MRLNGIRLYAQINGTMWSKYKYCPKFSSEHK